MTFSIELDSPPSLQATCVAGDRVVGRVVLRSTQDEAVGTVQIAFFGRAKTKIHRSNGQSRTTYKGRADFFRFNTTLYTGKFTLRSAEYVWPFEFTFPDTTLGCPQTGDWNVGHRFQYKSGHQMPPTFSANHYGFHGNYESFVEYKIKASLTRPPESYTFFSRGLTAENPLVYSPTRALEAPDPEFSKQKRSFTHASLLLVPENQGRSLTFKEKTRSILKSSELPRSSFVVWADIPQVICSAQKIPIFVGLKDLPENSTAPEIPAVKLTSIQLRLVATTSVRAPRHFSFAGEVCDTTTEKLCIEQVAGLNALMAERMDLSQHYSRSRMVLTPSFSTYNICRFYRLELKVTVRCIEKEFALEFQPQAIVVLPSIYIGQVATHSAPVSKLEMLAQGRAGREETAIGKSGEAQTDEPLPRYSERDPEDVAIAPPETPPIPYEVGNTTAHHHIGS